MKQIALLHYTAPPVIGNTENTIYHHARLLNQAGYAVSVISSGRDEAYYQISFRHQVEILPIAEMDPRHPRVAAVNDALEKGQSPPDFAALTTQLANGLAPRLENIQVCIVYNALTSGRNLALTAALAKLAPSKKTRFISWCQELDDHTDLDGRQDFQNAYPWNLIRTPWPGVSYAAARRSLRDRLVESLHLAAESIKLIPTGVDANLFLKWEPITLQLVEHLDLLRAYPLILLPTPIAKGNWIEAAIQTVGALKPKYPTIRLLVVQHPQAQSALEDAYVEQLHFLAKQAALGEHVSLIHKNNPVDHLPELSRPALFDLYQLADLLLLPNPSPPLMGIPLLEASLARLPIFTANAFPLPAEQNHLVYQFSPGEPEYLAHRIAAFLENDPTSQLRQQALKDFTWQAILEKHLIPLIEG